MNSLTIVFSHYEGKSILILAYVLVKKWNLTVKGYDIKIIVEIETKKYKTLFG